MYGPLCRAGLFPLAAERAVVFLVDLVSMDRDLRTSFGKRCRSLRASIGTSQEQFANSIGMDRSYYASIETGMRNATLESLNSIALGFGASVTIPSFMALYIE